MTRKPRRGEVWLADLSPAGRKGKVMQRPVLIVSVDAYNGGPAEMVAVLPVTSRDRKIPLHVGLGAGESGLRKRAYIMSDMIRSISTDRLTSRMGSASHNTIREAEDRVRIVLNL